MNKALVLFLLACLPAALFAQGTLSGDLQTNINFFQKDEKIGAANNPNYDNYLSGSEVWLSVRYNVKDWTFTLRADAFNNSNLANPKQALTAYGIGSYSITKEMEDLTITVGNIYDQIGSGILFRSYEDRGLLIDNALIGLELKYKLGKHILLKGFGGQQKKILERYQPIIKGFNAEGDYSVGKASLIPGVGVLNRTLDKTSMDIIAANINNQDISTRFLPRWNTYGVNAYNTLTYKNISWFVEGDYKTHEAIPDSAGSTRLVDKAGNVVFTTLNYAQKGFSINLSARRTENFFNRTSPNESLLAGIINWQPVVAVLRPERLISRYTPPSQELSEMGTSVTANYAPSEVTSFNATYSSINNLKDDKLYRELFGEVVYEGKKSWKFQAGVQYLEYNMQVYRGTPAPYIFAITPFAEVTYLINGSKSLRFEAQYMNTKQDFGSWVFALLEYNLAPKFSISISDMYNINPTALSHASAIGSGSSVPSGGSGDHYYSIYGAFSKGPHRFSLAYVKQVEGFNCTGGVCRYEPAFSGIRSTFSTRF